jgi:small subunit ribosomal protein S20
MSEALRAVESGDATAADVPVGQAIRALDVAVKKGILHRNNASRRKSRLVIKLNRLRGIGAH